MKNIPFTHVRDFYERNQPEGFWFSQGALDFFKTVLPENAYETSAGTLFFTRETSPARIKRFTVRRQDVNGDIDTVGDFHVYLTAASALAEIKRLDKEIV